MTKNTLYWWREQYPDLSVGELRELWSLLVERVTVRYQSQRDVQAALQSADGAKSLHDRPPTISCRRSVTRGSGRRTRKQASVIVVNAPPRRRRAGTVIRTTKAILRRPQVDALVRPEAPCA